MRNISKGNIVGCNVVYGLALWSNGKLTRGFSQQLPGIVIGFHLWQVRGQ